jgi:hypothetical protein
VNESAPALPERWQVVLDQMFAELGSGSPRAEAYWAQQLAFGPVFFYAVLLALRKGAIAPRDLDLLRKTVPLAVALLGALPDDCGGRPRRRRLLAHRQVQALELGRRQGLARLAKRLGLEVSSRLYEPVPRRLLRPYELIGWVPPRPNPVD